MAPAALGRRCSAGMPMWCSRCSTFASFLCCVTMSMPQQHLVAFCSDLGLSATMGATMLSLLLGMGFFSRQGWG